MLRNWIAVYGRVASSKRLSYGVFPFPLYSCDLCFKMWPFSMYRQTRTHTLPYVLYSMCASLSRKFNLQKNKISRYWSSDQHCLLSGGRPVQLIPVVLIFAPSHPRHIYVPTDMFPLIMYTMADDDCLLNPDAHCTISIYTSFTAFQKYSDRLRIPTIAHGYARRQLNGIRRRIKRCSTLYLLVPSIVVLSISFY